MIENGATFAQLGRITAGSWKLYKDGKVEAAGKGLKTGNYDTFTEHTDI